MSDTRTVKPGLAMPWWFVTMDDATRERTTDYVLGLHAEIADLRDQYCKLMEKYACQQSDETNARHGSEQARAERRILYQCLKPWLVWGIDSPGPAWQLAQLIRECDERLLSADEPSAPENWSFRTGDHSWQCGKCGHEWDEPAHRGVIDRPLCPKCTPEKSGDGLYFNPAHSMACPLRYTQYSNCTCGTT